MLTPERWAEGEREMWGGGGSIRREAEMWGGIEGGGKNRCNN